MVRDISNTPIEVVEKMSDEELRLLMKEDMDMGLGMVLIREMNARELKILSKPHWSVTPLFWVSLIAAVAACIAAYPVLFPPQVAQSAATVAPSALIVPPALGTVSSSPPQKLPASPQQSNKPQK
jgi:hypothetical protein